MKKITLMGNFGNDKLVLERQDNGSLMVEMVPASTLETGHSVFLDDAGQKRLKEYLFPSPDKRYRIYRQECRAENLIGNLHLDVIKQIHGSDIYINHARNYVIVKFA